MKESTKFIALASADTAASAVLGAGAACAGFALISENKSTAANIAGVLACGAGGYLMADAAIKTKALVRFIKIVRSLDMQ